MSPKKLPKPSNNVFQIMVRTVVREELIPIRTEVIDFKKEMIDFKKEIKNELDRSFSQFEDKFDEKLDNTFRKYRDEILTGQDQLMGELQAMRQELTMHQGQHLNLNSLPDRVENLEKIHPHSQHAQI